MDEEPTPSEEGYICPVSPIYRVGDTVVFKYEGNVRALVEGYQVGTCSAVGPALFYC